MKHSVIVFFVWHGLESCWRLAVVEPDESIVFYGLESCWRSVVSELFYCFFMGSKGDVKHFVCVFFAWHGLESCWCFGLFESDADESWRDFEQPSFGIHVSNGFLFCLAEARLLLAFGCFGTEALFFFLTYYFLLFSYIYLFFLMGSKGDVKQSILSACFLLGMGSNLAGVSVFSNLTLTRLWAAIVRNPRSCLWLYVRFERFFAWQRLDCCWRSGVSEPKLCFLLLFFMGSKGDVKHSVCVFFAWHGLESCWCFGLFESDADETLSSHRSESTAFGCSGTGPRLCFL